MDRPGRSGRLHRRTLHHAVAEPRGERLRPEGGEVVVEVAVLGGEDGGGEALGERPGFERGRGGAAPSRGRVRAVGLRVPGLYHWQGEEGAGLVEGGAQRSRPDFGDG